MVDDELGKFTFIDFAGSGIVHLCGKTFNGEMCHSKSLLSSLGGIGGLTLALFHKLERSRRIRSKLQDCCSLLRRQQVTMVAMATNYLLLLIVCGQ